MNKEGDDLEEESQTNGQRGRTNNNVEREDNIVMGEKKTKWQ